MIGFGINRSVDSIEKAWLTLTYRDLLECLVGPEEDGTAQRDVHHSAVVCAYVGVGQWLGLQTKSPSHTPPAPPASNIHHLTHRIPWHEPAVERPDALLLRHAHQTVQQALVVARGARAYVSCAYGIVRRQN